MNESIVKLGKISLRGESRCFGERKKYDKIVTCLLTLRAGKIVRIIKRS